MTFLGTPWMPRFFLRRASITNSESPRHQFLEDLGNKNPFFTSFLVNSFGPKRCFLLFAISPSPKPKKKTHHPAIQTIQRLLSLSSCIKSFRCPGVKGWHHLLSHQWCCKIDKRVSFGRKITTCVILQMFFWNLHLLCPDLWVWIDMRCTQKRLGTEKKDFWRPKILGTRPFFKILPSYIRWRRNVFIRGGTCTLSSKHVYWFHETNEEIQVSTFDIPVFTTTWSWSLEDLLGDFYEKKTWGFWWTEYVAIEGSYYLKKKTKATQEVLCDFLPCHWGHWESPCL